VVEVLNLEPAHLNVAPGEGADHCKKLMHELPRHKLLRLVFFLMQAPIGILLPSFVLYLRFDRQFSESQISLITALGGLTIVLFQQAWGYFADVVFRKKQLILANLAISGLLFWSIAFVPSYWAIVCVVFAFNVFSTPLVQLLHGLLFSHRGSERWFGPLRAYGSLGFVVTNLAVAYVADRLTDGNLRFIFPLYAALCAATFVCVMPVPEAKVVRASDRPSFWAVQWYFLRRPPVAIFLGFVFLYQCAHSLSYTLQSILMKNMGADHTLIASSYSLAAVLEVPVFFAAHRLLKKFGAERLLAFAAVVQSIRWILVWKATSPTEIVAISALHAITFGLFYAAAVSYINSHAPYKFKASAQTLFAFVYFGWAGIVSNLVGGQVTRGGIFEQPLTNFLRRVLPFSGQDPLANLYLFSAGVAAVAALLAFVLCFTRGQMPDQPE